MNYMMTEDENFEALRRLLALKRHEQPPPGYFAQFSHRVIARIEAEQAAREQGLFGRWLGQYRWFDRVRGIFEGQPAMAGALGLIVCGLLAGGAFLSEQAPGPALPVTGPTLPDRSATIHRGLQMVQFSPTVQFSRTNGIQRLHQSLFNPDAQLVSDSFVSGF